MSESYFINPYNFVPFGETGSLEKNKDTRERKYCSDDKLVSGWMDVSVHIKTPLIIPDGAHPEYHRIENGKLSADPFVPKNVYEQKNSHKVYCFQKLPDVNGKSVPAIPGSELRGTIRSAYETVTDSCVPFLLKDMRISQRVPIFGALRRRGLLCRENGQWVLYCTITVGKEIVSVEEDEIKEKAKTDNAKKDKTEKRVFLVRNDGKEVKEKTGSYSDKYGGVMQYNIPVDKSKPYHIAYLKKDKIIKKWDNDEPYRYLHSVLDRDEVDKHLPNPNQKPANDLRDALDKEKDGKNGHIGVPVYYFFVEHKQDEVTERLVYISNSAIGRIAQRRKWKDIIGDHSPCDGKNGLCPACLLFGSKEDNGLKSRVRFSDAFPDGEITLEKHCIGILGNPRPSAFEFYLEKPENATYWNFDFYGTKDLDNKETYTEYHHLDKATPRGRKMYWHSNTARDVAPNKLNSTMEAAKTGVFRFKVFFDEITEVQLGDLIWTITMGDNRKESNLQFKLGHAKPYGYGSCKMTVDGLHKRTVEWDGTKMSIRIIDSKVSEPTLSYGTDNRSVRSFLKMADASAASEAPVEYPNHGNKTYEWFAENRTNEERLVVLPDPLAYSIALANVSKDDRQKNGSSKNGSSKNSSLKSGYSKNYKSFNKDGKVHSDKNKNSRNIKKVLVKKVKPNTNDNTKFVAEYAEGKAFDVPAETKAGDSIMVEVTGRKGNVEFATYRGQA